MKIKEVLHVLTKRSFIVSLLFAIALWIYTSFNSVYKYYTTVPFSIQLPETRAIENDLPKTFILQVQGTGWNLFNLNAFNNSKKIFIDWSKKQIDDSTVVVTRSDFLKGVQSMEGVQVEEFTPEFLTIKTGRIVTKKVPLVHNIKIIPNENFTLVGNIMLIPDSVEISGNEKLLATIIEWRTVDAEFKEITQTFRSEINLSDTLSGIVSLRRTKVDFYTDIQQLAEIEIPDVELVIRGGSMPRDSKLYPPQVNLIVQGGINELEKLTKERVAATLDINDIISDSTGVMIPKIDIPSGFKLLKMEPRYIYHYKESKINSLTQIK